jgi:uncharacterized protein (TIGR02147 family)
VAQDLFAQDEYRMTLKARMKELQVERPALTWRKLASEIPMQYTYLSKALNDEDTHLSEDHLFNVCRALEFFPDETEFLFLQRSYATARDSERKEHLLRKIRDLRQSRKLNAKDQALSSSQLAEQVRYLFEPLCLIVHQALDVAEYRKDPRRLCAPLSITVGQLKEILRVLSRNDYIELEDDGLTVRKLKAGDIHFGPNHFLMRYHLSMVKSQMIARVSRTVEEDKFGFLVTFTMDEPSFKKIRDEFQEFLKSVEKIASKAKNESVYQLSFDLFKWL